MESSIAAPSESTGSTTIADMAARAAERFGDRVPVLLGRERQEIGDRARACRARAWRQRSSFHRPSRGGFQGLLRGSLCARAARRAGGYAFAAA